MKTDRKKPGSKPASPNPNIWRRSHQGRMTTNEASSGCPFPSACGSCDTIKRPYAEMLSEKVAHAAKFFHAAGLMDGVQVLAAVPSPVTLGYRTHAKLAVRAAKPGRRREPDMPVERLAIGLYKPGTHEVIPMLSCPIHRHVINEVLADLKVELEGSSLQPYDEQSDSGDLKYLGIRVSHLTSEVMLTFVLTGEHKAEIRRIVNAVRLKGHHIVSAHMNINPGNNNAIFSENNVLAAGSDRLRERLCDIHFELGPTSFMQINPWQAEIMYRRIESLAGAPQKNAVAWDLYSGMGPISLILSRAGFRVLGIEENPAAVEDARHNTNRNKEIKEPTFLVGTVEEQVNRAPTWARNPELIVANPSRRGIADAARAMIRQTLIENPRSKFVYMSCEAETLARDLKDIIAGTNLKIRQIEPFDMFPFTEKVEWLTVVTH
jgi:23S rRNA (uracil1939-C5)-methyltransferase